MDKKVRWGILGPGKIAHSFAKDLQKVTDGELLAVASRSLERAKSFAHEYGAKYAFGSYEELFNCEQVDVIYIATPHTSHVAQSIAAMEHGKNVLCEKPLGVNEGEVRKMLASAEKNKVFLMEALWSRFNPSIKKVKELLDSGAIGTLKYLHATFGFFALDRDPEGRLLNPALAGGSILDIGIYPIFLAYLMLGVPDRILSSSKLNEGGVEVQTAMVFDYPESQALLFSGLGARTEMRAELGGTAGNLLLHPRWHETQGYSLIKDGDTKSFELPTLGKGYSHEIEEVHSCLRQGKKQSGLWSHANSLDLARIMDMIRKQNGVSFPFED